MSLKTVWVGMGDFLRDGEIVQDLVVLESSPEDSAGRIWTEVPLERQLKDLDPETRASVELGLQQAREGKFSSPPNLKEMLDFAEQCEKEEDTQKRVVWVGIRDVGLAKDLVVQDQKPASTDGKTWKKVEVQSHDTTKVSVKYLEEAIDLVNSLVKKSPEGAATTAEKIHTLLEQRYNIAYYTKLEDSDKKCREALDAEMSSPSPKPKIVADSDDGGDISTEAIELGNGLKDAYNENYWKGIQEKIEAGEATEQETMDFVSKKIREGLKKALKPPTATGIKNRNLRWLEMFMESTRRRAKDLYDNADSVNVSEDKGINITLTFRYDRDLDVLRLTNLGESFDFQLNEPIKSTFQRFSIADDAFVDVEDEKE